MILSRLALLCVLVFAALGAGCAAGTADGGPSPSGDTSQCTDVFVYAPGAYVIHIASDAAVILDPLANDFPVFCDAKSAQKGLEQEISAGRLPAGNWKIYKLYGAWSDLATEVSPSVFLLNKPAPLVDWVT